MELPDRFNLPASLSSQETNPSELDWKDFLLKHKWMPSAMLLEKFHLKKYDFDNFCRKPAVRGVVNSWRISLKQSPENLQAIFTQAWKYYITEVEGINLDDPPGIWIPKLISVKNVSRGEAKFGFLTNSRYYKVACPKQLTDFRSKGFTNVALGVYTFWPGRELLDRAAVLPFMFLQTHRLVLKHVDLESMIEHVYLSFIAGTGVLSSAELLLEAKERLYVRHDEPQFLTKEVLQRFGVPYNFYKDEGGLKVILRKLANKYAMELGYVPEKDTVWSASIFRKRFPEKVVETCEYCGLRPVDLHHLLPREK